MGSVQVIVGHPRTEMVYVVEADVTGKPLQHLGQFVKRAPLEGRIHITPLFILLIIGTLKLVLHIEEPDTGPAGDEKDRSLNQQERLPTDRPAEHPSDGGDPNVGEIRIHPLFSPGPLAVKPVIDQKDVDRSQSEHDQGIAIKTVSQPLPTGQSQVFIDGQGPNIPGAVPI